MGTHEGGDKFGYLRGNRGSAEGRGQRIHADLSPLQRYQREQSGQYRDLHHPSQPPQPSVDSQGQPILTPAQIQRALADARQQRRSAGRPIHPDTPSDWRIPDLPEGNRRRKRRNGRGSQGGPYVNRPRSR